MPNTPDATARSTQRRSLGDSGPAHELLQAVVDRLGIGSQWDLLLVGDGSGNSWNAPAGWATAFVDHLTRERKLYRGCCNEASINFAEAIPYQQALTKFHAQQGKARLRSLGVLRVHIITDSDVVATWGNQTANPTLPLPEQVLVWAGFRELCRLGYHLVWHWVKRNNCELNLLADLVASLMREAVINHETRTGLIEAVRQMEVSQPLVGINIHELNPFDPEPPAHVPH
jgi:ribonuclease HI